MAVDVSRTSNGVNVGTEEEEVDDNVDYLEEFYYLLSYEDRGNK